MTEKAKRSRRKMSPEQKKAAAERLAKAREERKKNNPPEYKSIHESVLTKPEDDPLSLKNVRAYIKTSQEKIAAEKSNLRSGNKDSLAKINSLEGYVRNLNSYLKYGDYMDMFWGHNQEHLIKNVCVRLSYDSEGYPSRNVHTYYPDIGCEWTYEMDREERARREQNRRSK